MNLITAYLIGAIVALLINSVWVLPRVPRSYKIETVIFAVASTTLLSWIYVLDFIIERSSGTK